MDSCKDRNLIYTRNLKLQSLAKADPFFQLRYRILSGNFPAHFPAPEREDKGIIEKIAIYIMKLDTFVKFFLQKNAILFFRV